MQPLRIFSVNGSDRSWDSWLDTRDLVSEPQTTDFFESRWYEGEGRFLMLIHMGGALKDNDDGIMAAQDYELDWEKLPPGQRDRVWWLFYSASGYHEVSSKKA